ncbi:uncharacterized protein LOC141768360 isoform X2 [Sebastes fasciatus]|uniref:uncharacterized protein LOC141768360 isoform X2 n=1 Tax=Sebastes fasciatus TaxID=394691 RepID=UPI003D9F12C6
MSLVSITLLHFRPRHFGATWTSSVVCHTLRDHHFTVFTKVHQESLTEIYQQAPSLPSINMTRDVVIQCLMVYLGESTDQLLKEYDDADEDSVSQDLAVQRMKIYNIKTNTSEVPGDIGIVIEGMKVLTALGNFPRACSLLVGLAYAVNLAYPKELRYTLEVFQKLFLKLDCLNLSPKVNSVKNKLLA